MVSYHKILIILFSTFCISCYAKDFYITGTRSCIKITKQYKDNNQKNWEISDKADIQLEFPILFKIRNFSIKPEIVYARLFNKELNKTFNFKKEANTEFNSSSQNKQNANGVWPQEPSWSFSPLLTPIETEGAIEEKDEAISTNVDLFGLNIKGSYAIAYRNTTFFVGIMPYSGIIINSKENMQRIKKYIPTSRIEGGVRSSIFHKNLYGTFSIKYTYPRNCPSSCYVHAGISINI